MFLGLLLTSWLVLAKAATLVTKGVSVAEPPLLGSFEGVLQERVRPEKIPLQFPLQKEIDLTEGLEFPMQALDQPMLRPRGIPRFNLDEFPPARPTPANLASICSVGRKKLSYGPWNLPQTSFSHLTRQGEALNDLEAGMNPCCQLDAGEKLLCLTGVWFDTLKFFCLSEFAVKTKPYHCCELEGPDWESCFVREAPFSQYDFEVQTSPGEEPFCPECESPRALGLSFPPGRPTQSNIGNVCKLRKLRRSALAATPLSHPVWLAHQEQAVSGVESEFKKCCRKQDVLCALKGWEKILIQFCGREFSIKTKPYECCLRQHKKDRFACFASHAPFPAYDKEIQSVSLAEIDSPLLDTLCGQFVLLSKQKKIPNLIQNITESCCQLQASERIQCAKDVKSQFATTLCTSQRNTWKDPGQCCAQAGGAGRETCFDSNYLSAVSLASAGQPLPTEIPIEIPTE